MKVCFSEGLVRRIETILGVQTGRELIEGFRCLQNIWRCWANKGQTGLVLALGFSACFHGVRKLQKYRMPSNPSYFHPNPMLFDFLKDNKRL